MKDNKKRIVWTDVESDGLDPYKGNQLLEVAVLVTDGELNEINDGLSVTIGYSREDAAIMRSETNEFVREMHDKNGLWESITTDGVTLVEAEELVLRELKTHGVKKSESWLGGNSITLDRNFLNVYMPHLYGFLHYRSYDMTSISNFVRLCRPEVKSFRKNKAHTALEDIRESVAEAQYYAKIIKNIT